MAQQVAQLRSRFALEYHRDTKGRRLNFNDRNYLLSLYSDVHPDIVCRVPVQIGKTEWEVCDSFACAALGLSVFCIQPKFELRGVHVAERYDKLISNSPEYLNLSRSSGHRSRDSTNLKHFGKGSLRFVGSKVDSDMISFPADVVSVDELDRCDLEIISLAEDRFQESEYKFIRRTSTPTVQGSPFLRNTDYYYINSDQKRWFVPCPECGAWQEIRWDTHLCKVEKDSDGRFIDMSLVDDDWTQGKWERTKQRIRLPCIECGQPINRLARGEYRRQRPELARLRSGYTMSRLCAPSSTIEEIWIDLENSFGNPSQMQRIQNSIFGEPYSGFGDRISHSMILDATAVLSLPYTIPLYPGDHRLGGKSKGLPAACMGIDVNRPWLDYWIADFPSVKHRKFVVRTRAFGRVKDPDELLDLVKDYNVHLAVIDAEPEVRLSCNFQDQAKCRVWRAMYRHTETTMLKQMQFDEAAGLVYIDRTSNLDRVLQAFLLKQLALPLNYKDWIGGQLEEQLCAPVRALEIKDGAERYVWKGEGAHFFHVCGYMLLAQRLGNFQPMGDPSKLRVGSGVLTQRSDTERMIQRYDELDEPATTPASGRPGVDVFAGF